MANPNLAATSGACRGRQHSDCLSRCAERLWDRQVERVPSKQHEQRRAAGRGRDRASHRHFTAGSSCWQLVIASRPSPAHARGVQWRQIPMSMVSEQRQESRTTSRAGALSASRASVKAVAHTPRLGQLASAVPAECHCRVPVDCVRAKRAPIPSPGRSVVCPRMPVRRSVPCQHLEVVHDVTAGYSPAVRNSAIP